MLSASGGVVACEAAGGAAASGAVVSGAVAVVFGVGGFEAIVSRVCGETGGSCADFDAVASCADRSVLASTV